MRARSGHEGPWFLYTIALGLLATLFAGGARADVVHPLPYDLLYVRAPWSGRARRPTAASGPTPPAR